MLNSAFVQWLLKWALAKSGFLVSAAVTWLLVHFGIEKLLSPEDYAKIADGLNAGGIALIASFYAWLSGRNQAGVKTLQAMHNMGAKPSNQIKVDGIAGNATLKAVGNASDIPVKTAIAVADQS